jgi:glycosyltransferase involved in cell wall biosynthesis
VTFICTARASYTRNETLLASLREHYRVLAVSSDRGTYPQRLATVLPRAVLRLQTSDIVVAGFLAQPLAPLLRLPGRSRLLVADAFISLYETLCEDRGAIRPSSPVARVARWLDSSLLRRADLILTDTLANADYLSDAYGICRERFVAIYVGANEQLFHPRPQPRSDNRFQVFYYTTYLPLHGVDVVIRAASLLAGQDDIRITIVGDGPERPRVQRIAAQLGVRNVSFVDPVPYKHLPGMIAAADVCLGGHFNAQNAKARRVVPGKVFQFTAMGKPTLAGACPGVREAFTDGADAVLVPMGDPEALAAGVLRLASDPELRVRIGRGGLERFRRDYSLQATARRLRSALDRAMGGMIVDEHAA